MNIPILYQEGNVYSSMKNPSGVVVGNTESSQFFRRYLLQKAMSVFKWKLPENWSERYFLYTLYLNGTVAIINTDKFGVIPQQCSLFGYNVFYQPSGVIIANPLIKQMPPLVIDRDCTLFTMTEDYCGIADLVNYYGDMMALVSESMAVNIFNSRLAYILFAGDTTTANGMKKMTDRLLSGEPYIVVDKKFRDGAGNLSMEMFNRDIKNGFIAPELMTLLQDIENQFATEIGIPNANTAKKERMIVDEVNSNNVETYSRCDMWFSNWKKQCEKTKKMFGVEIDVEWRYSQDAERGVDVNAD